jgi:hypothetical protein
VVAGVCYIEVACCIYCNAGRGVKLCVVPNAIGKAILATGKRADLARRGDLAYAGVPRDL